MTRIILTTVIVTLALALMAAFAIAQEPILVNYQGQLNGSTGDPVPDGSYEVSFGLWDDPANGIQLWTEVHPAVQTSNGMFSVELGSIDPFDLATLQTQPLYLEIQVEGDSPMSPRIHLTSVPRGAIAQRVNGDIITEPSTLKIHPPDPFEPAGIQLSASEEEIGMAIQGIPGGPTAGMAITLTVDWEDAAIIVQNIPEGESSGPTVEISATADMADLILENLPSPGGPAGSSIGLMSNNGAAEILVQALPSPGHTSGAAEMTAGPLGSSFRLGGPQNGGLRLEITDPILELTADESSGNFRINWAEPLGVTSPAIEIANVGNTGSRIWMYHPLADPPGPMVEINADPINGNSITLHSAEPLLGGSVDIRGTSTSGGIISLNHNPAPHEQLSVIELSSAPPDFGTIKMFNGRLDPPPVYLEMNTAFSAEQTGSNFIMYNPDAPNYGEPMIELSTNAGADQWGASLVMFNPQPEPPGSDPDPFIEMQTFENSASFVMFNPQPEPPGQDPLMGMFTNPLGANFEMTAPGMGRAGAEITDPIIEMATDASGGDFRINWAEPLGVTSPAIEIANVGNTGSRIWMYHPLADPPGPMVEINADPTNGSSIAIHSAEPLLGEGVKIAGTSTIGGIITLNTNPAPHEEVKVIELSSESPNGGSFKMFNPEFDPPPVLMEMSTSFNARELGARIKLFDTAGGTTVEISNDGDIQAKRGNFGSGNTLTGLSAFVAGSFNTVGGQEAFAAGESNTVNGFRATILGGDNNTANGMRSTVCGGSYNSVYATSAVIPGGYNSTINAGALYSCLIGIDASLSEDSTFMVDMPHIRFGNASGYEFPTVDGDVDQVMITDGSGQLSWVDLARIYGGGIEKLANTIDELKRQNSELEQRITELEAERR